MKFLLTLFYKYTNLQIHVAGCLALYVLYQSERADLTLQSPYVWLVFFASGLFYNLHAVPLKDLGLKAMWTGHGFMVFVFLILSLFVGFFLDTTYFLWLLPAGLVALAYTLPIFSGAKKGSESGWCKILILSFCLVYTLTFIPLILSDIDPWKLAWLTFTSWLFIFPVALIFDSSDISKDNSVQLKNLPARLGLMNAKRLGYLLIGLGVMSDIYLANHFILDIHDLVAGLIGYICIAIALIFVKDEPRLPAFSFLVDLILALPYLLILLFTL